MVDTARRPLRVLQLMECTIGGTRRHITDLARGLLAEGVDVQLGVAAERQPGFRDTMSELESEGCGVHEVPMSRSISPLHDGRQLARLTTLIRELRPDVVHTHSSKAGVLGRCASLRAGIGVRVHTPHTFAFLFREMFGPLKRAAFRRIETALANRTDAIVAVSPSEAQTFASAGVCAAEKIHVVPNGIHPSLYRGIEPLDVAEVGLDPGRPTAAVVGLLNVAKGQDLALQALALPQSPRDLQLMIVGHGEQRAELEASIDRLGLSDRVAMLGFREDVPAILAASDCLLLPSRWEGMPYIVMEAMASGLPVVATPVDGARDLVLPGETGFLAAEVSPPAISASLGELLALEPFQRSALGEAGRDRIDQGYTVSRMVKGLRELYEAILP